jgi:zinc and cadmium transporter
MNKEFLYALIATFIGSGLAIILAASLALFPSRIRSWLIPSLVSFATGSLLGASFLGLIPETLEAIPAENCFITIIIGILIFFVLEKMIIWRHCHKQGCEIHDSSSKLILIGDAVHNFLDGIALAAAFMTSIPLGITTAFGIFAHELPQEIGDYAILLNSGYSRRRALWLNAISGATAIPGVIIGYFFVSSAASLTPYAMALAAASFIYIAVADLIPGLQKKNGIKESLLQISLILLGLGTIILFDHLLQAH